MRMREAIGYTLTSITRSPSLEEWKSHFSSLLETEVFRLIDLDVEKCLRNANVNLERLQTKVLSLSLSSLFLSLSLSPSLSLSLSLSLCLCLCLCLSLSLSFSCLTIPSQHFSLSDIDSVFAMENALRDLDRSIVKPEQTQYSLESLRSSLLNAVTIFPVSLIVTPSVLPTFQQRVWMN